MLSPISEGLLVTCLTHIVQVIPFTLMDLCPCIVIFFLVACLYGSFGKSSSKQKISIL